MAGPSREMTMEEADLPSREFGPASQRGLCASFMPGTASAKLSAISSRISAPVTDTVGTPWTMNWLHRMLTRGVLGLTPNSCRASTMRPDSLSVSVPANSGGGSEHNVAPQ